MSFDVGQTLSQVLVSLITPAVMLAPFLIKYQRQKLANEARGAGSTADETDAKAEVLLSGEALELFRAARTDATEAREEARNARSEAASCRRQNVELWARVDAFDRYVRQVVRALEDHGGVPPPRPAELDHHLGT